MVGWDVCTLKWPPVGYTVVPPHIELATGALQGGTSAQTTRNNSFTVLLHVKRF
jgi:hypothetical protein